MTQLKKTSVHYGASAKIIHYLEYKIGKDRHS